MQVPLSRNTLKLISFLAKYDEKELREVIQVAIGYYISYRSMNNPELLELVEKSEPKINQKTNLSTLWRDNKLK